MQVDDSKKLHMNSGNETVLSTDHGQYLQKLNHIYWKDCLLKKDCDFQSQQERTDTV